jgi:hypothetical protein
LAGKFNRSRTETRRRTESNDSKKAGHTYGAAGIWQESVEGDPGITTIYDWATWKQGMDYSASIQLGLGKKLLEKYPWHRFEPHPE